MASFCVAKLPPLSPPFMPAKGFEAGCASLLEAPKVKEEDAPGTEKLKD